MSEPTPYISHVPYIEAIANALDAAGLTVVDWNADDTDPRDAHLEFDRQITAPAYGDDTEVNLLWREDRGWMAGWGDDDSQGGLDWIVDLFCGVLPTPDEMVTEARTIVAKIPGPQGAPYGRYRDSGDDDGLDAQLATYHRTQTWPSPDQAYAAAPSINSESDWATRTANEWADEGLDREWYLRHAAVLDRIALGIAHLDNQPGAAHAAEEADAAAVMLLDLDQARRDYDPRAYVRQQYALWHAQQDTSPEPFHS